MTQSFGVLLAWRFCRAFSLYGATTVRATVPREESFRTMYVISRICTKEAFPGQVPCLSSVRRTILSRHGGTICRRYGIMLRVSRCRAISYLNAPADVCSRAICTTLASLSIVLPSARCSPSQASTTGSICFASWSSFRPGTRRAVPA